MFAGALLLAMGFAASSAVAETHVLRRAGIWEAFGGSTTSGRPVCGVSSQVQDKYFGWKYFYGDDTFTIQLGKSSWQIDDGAKQKVMMQFDQNSPWNATATGMHFNDGDAGLEFTINRSQLDEFEQEFRSSNQAMVRFPGSDAQDWFVPLQGVNSVFDAFRQCILKMQ
ncbi:MAG TPA: hypothetical protein VK433_03100 [Stellaceae bacterium]|nr:hypothetical protein [Stellaceae bacterium]